MPQLTTSHNALPETKSEKSQNAESSRPTPEKTPRRRFVGKGGPAINNRSGSQSAVCGPHQIPTSILEDKLLNAAIAELLPQNYNFEVLKTVAQVIRHKIKVLGLQMPEGLLQWSLVLSDLFRKFCPDCEDVVVLGDVTYGACCVDDYTARSLGCEMLVHYGHSCLIPVDQTSIKTLYVFVEIGIDRSHLRDTVRANFPMCLPQQDCRQSDASNNKGANPIEIALEDGPCNSRPTSTDVHLAVVGTVQFVAAVQGLKTDLERPPPLPNVMERLKITNLPHDSQTGIRPLPSLAPVQFRVTVPQVKPLSPGEILGCTAPKLDVDVDAILYVGDGRFHLESIMIANPNIPAFRYDPYEKRITEEGYDHRQMRQLRGRSIQKAIASLNEVRTPAVSGQSDISKSWAIVIGTLGRQGSLNVVNSLSTGLRARTGDRDQIPVPILISELSPQKLNLFKEDIGIFVQTSCPRLSIDWGESFEIPLLNPYEAKVSLGQARGYVGMGDDGADHLENYPMDFYADNSLGDWTPRYGKGVKTVRIPKTR
ncbi:hypothetical protein CROQUDRAFT_653274 [Cronartium quercuum f. sp. fusiforme G11]|uniref:2-(3-amino-3-carboxypropyl)histidine synthase subunit 1 n=1 Tax=Cronartium quercuum f. sp. fusiforme G11 TaxID=708437 RepID=A0A9P6NSZ2_9BASI|nr:hypothetical protein CROQUDRAFT_653274 [Cronartium quercuum f. sp. fusiforme G11]